MPPPQEARALRPHEKTIIAQAAIHITFLLSAMAIAAADRIMPAAPEKHGEHA
jgi:uncharacterized membrane protein YqhA